MFPKLRTATTCLFWLAVWQFAAWRVASPLFLPGPLTVVVRLSELVQTAPFWQTAVLTLCRVVLGMLWGTALGVVLACLACTGRWLDTILSPAVRVIRATPVASFILLVFLWTDRDQVPVIIAALMVLPVVWGNVVRGIRECDPKLLEFAKAYRFSRLKTARLVLLPAVKPYFLSAVTTSMGLAWKSGVAAEALVLPKLAIGTQIYNTKFYLETADLFAWTVAVILLSLTLEKLIALLIRQSEGRPVA
ncbi:MAG: ABC transporter permease subunit [Oscillospiraceae bacterium]|nr:ABC transporter permease subunit [Oscillospiraceae bacterium]